MRNLAGRNHGSGAARIIALVQSVKSVQPIESIKQVQSTRRFKPVKPIESVIDLQPDGPCRPTTTFAKHKDHRRAGENFIGR